MLSVSHQFLLTFLSLSGRELRSILYSEMDSEVAEKRGADGGKIARCGQGPTWACLSPTPCNCKKCSLRREPYSFFLINFSWSIVALKCCVGFYCTAK